MRRVPGARILFGMLLCASFCSPRADGQTVVSLPTYGIELTLPGEWVKEPEAHGGVVTRWSPAKANPQDDFFEVVAVPLGSSSAMGRAEADAQRFGGTIEEGVIDGRRAYRVIVPGEAFVTGYCTRSDILYSIGYRRSSADADELRTILDSWKWKEAESPTKHLDNDNKRITLLDRVSLEIPAWMRLDKLPSGEPVLGGYSHMGGRVRSDVHLVVEIHARDAGVPLQQLTESLGMAMAAMAKMNRPAHFQTTGPQRDRSVSEPVKSSDGMIKMTRVAVVALDAQTRATLRMHVFTSRQAEQDAYGQWFEKIVASVKPAEQIK
jgi:hypothetical protein